MSEKALTPIEQKEVLLYEDSITAVRAADDGQVYVVVAHLCDALGLDTQAQARRMNRHAVLAKGLTWVAILTTQGTQSQHRRVQVLRVDLVPLWLSGIRASMVNEAIRPKLEQFQEQAAAVLWEAFQDGRLTGDPTFDELLQQDTPEVEAYKMIQGMLRLAQNQIVLRARLDDHEQRLESIEATLSDPARFISQAQASRISQAVRAIGLAMSERSKQNEYGRVYGEFYRAFDVPAYRELPAHKYEQAMAWLNAWYQRLTNQDIPF